MKLRYKHFESATLWILGILYIVTSALQFYAVVNWLQCLGFTKLVSFCTSVLVSYIPVIGTAFGAYALNALWNLSAETIVIIFIPLTIGYIFIVATFYIHSIQSK